MSCGQIDFLEGGTLQNVTVIGGQVSSALVQGCALDSCNLTHLRDIDTASAELIAKALMNLPAATLAALAKVLFKACEGNSDCCCSRIVPPPFSRSLIPPPPPPTPVVIVSSGDNTTSDEGEGTGDTEAGQGTAPSSPHCGHCMMPPPPPPMQPVVIISGGDDDEEGSDEGEGNG